MVVLDMIKQSLIDPLIRFVGLIASICPSHGYLLLLVLTAQVERKSILCEGLNFACTQCLNSFFNVPKSSL